MEDLDYRQEQEVLEEAYFFHIVKEFSTFCKLYGTFYMKRCLSREGIDINNDKEIPAILR